MVKPGRILADPARERIGTPATIVTFVRTAAAVALAAVAASQGSKTLLVVALLVHWVGDSLDGQVARMFDCETRTGAVIDILSDRLCAAAFYIGLAWLEPNLAPAIFVYLAEFMVVDGFLSICFLAWPITSPNYFYVIDRRLWLLNWSHPGKAVNSGLFAILLLVTGWMWVGLAIAVVLLPQVHLAGSADAARDAALRCTPAVSRRGRGAVRDGPRLAVRSRPLRRRAGSPHRSAREAGPDHLRRGLRLGHHPVHQHRGLPRRRRCGHPGLRGVVGGPGGRGRPDRGQGRSLLRRRLDDEAAVDRKKMATPKWKESYERWAKRIDTHPGETAALLFASASLGLPAAVRDGRARRPAARPAVFVTTCLIGRYLRFLVILGAADWFVHLF